MASNFVRPADRITLLNYLMVLAVLVATLPLADPALPTTIEQPAHPALSPPESAPIMAQPTAPSSGFATPAVPDDALQAFIRDDAHGDGKHTVLIADHAQNYQAEDGSWQPIETRFSREVTGFSSLRNLLQVRAEPDRAAMRLTRGAATLAWTPESLVLASENGVFPLATSRREPGGTGGMLANDEHSLSYANSWTLPGLSDELLVGPGAIEHNVIFATRPSLPAALAANSALTLELSVLLTLPPGYQIAAVGKVQQSAFTTDGALELRDAAGHPQLTIAPAVIFERARPQERIGARYHLEPLDAARWRVTMESPWHWWAAPERRFPVVWDPKLSVLGPLTVKKVAQKPGGAGCGFDGFTTGVGFKPECGDVRTLIKFNGVRRELLPRESTITRARLVAVATGGLYNSYNYAWTTAAVERLTDGAWLIGNPTWPGGGTDGQVRCTFGFIVGAGSSLPHSCNLQFGNAGLVSDWINGASNFGLLIRNNAPCNNYFGCPFVTFPTIGMQSSSLGDSTTDYDSTTEDWFRSDGGFALVIEYSGPTLPLDTVYGYGSNPPRPPIPDGPDLRRTYHGYEIPSSNGDWTVAIVKSLRTSTVIDGVTTAGLFSYSPAHPLSARQRNCLGNGCTTWARGDGTIDSTNFLLFKGSSYSNKELRVNAIQNQTQPDQYALQVASATALPAPPADAATNGAVYSQTVDLSTDQLVQAFSLPTLADTRVGVRMTIDNGGLCGCTASVNMHLFPPNGQIYAKGDSLGHFTTAESGASATQRLRSTQATAGNWGLVLELPGNVTAYSTANNTPPDGRVPRIRNLKVTLEIRVCPKNSILTDNGCAVVAPPGPNQTPANTPSLWHQAGAYWFFSPAGFTGANPGTVCSARRANGIEYATLVTWGASLDRYLVVAGGDVCEFGQNNPTIIMSGIFELAKGAASGDIASRFELLEGTGVTFYSSPIATFPTIKQSYAGQVISRLDFDRGTGAITVNMVPNGQISQQKALFTQTIFRSLQTVNGTQDQNFNLAWSVQAEGYAGWDDSPDGTGPLDVSLTPTNQINPLPIASMTYRFNYGGATPWEIRYDPQARLFTDIRNNSGRVVHDAKLGGAWGYVDFVIGTFGQGASGGNGLASCGAFCGDLRDPADTWAAPKRTWRMPDVLINQTPQTVMVSRAGALEVFSSDHPQQAELMDAQQAGFSFKTFGASVSVDEQPCPGVGGPPVQVIKGTTSLAMPGLGSETDPSYGIAAAFVLCASALREVTLTFEATPGIPVAQPPALWVQLIGGKVTLNPDYARINVDIGFFVGDVVAEPKPFKGTATLTIDTRGLFDLQAKGRIMGVMDGDAHLWVAWNPLDTGMGAQGFFPNKDAYVMSGFLYGHVWRGSGWQNRYPWLAGNTDFHMTASYQAQFKLKEGAISDDFFIDIPPDDVMIAVELSFGQFCANDSCTAFQWGIKGKVNVLDFDIGVYVNLDCIRKVPVPIPPVVLSCTSFILGSDGHILIDQYGPGGPPFPQSVQASEATSNMIFGAAQPPELQAQRVSNPAAALFEQPVTVRATTTSFMAGLSWARGKPTLSLVRPDGVEITAANATVNGVKVSSRGQQILFGMANPPAGNWKLRINGATATDDYHIVFFTNKVAPALAFVTPSATQTINATTDGTSSQPYRIQWTPPADSANLRVSLYYSATNTGALTTTQQVGGVIRENLDPATGFYDWDLSYLGNGDYAIYATLQDARGAQVSRFAENQYVGVTTSVAPGTLRYRDAIPPPPVGGTVSLTPADSGLLACWNVGSAHDLSLYQLRYSISDSLYANPRVRTELVLATRSSGPGARQCTRIVGLTAGDSRIDLSGGGVAPVDATGNVGAFTVGGSSTASTGSFVAPGAVTISGTLNPDRSATLTWPAVYKNTTLYYARDVAAGPWQDLADGAPGGGVVVFDDLNFSGSTVVSNLTPGYWYSFAVRGTGPNPNAPASPLSNVLWLFVTDGVDANGDGVPDDWQTTHGLPDANGDPDGDGLTNREEATRGTDPSLRNTDGDAWSDGDEVQYGTDPRDPLSFPQFDPSDPNKVVPLPQLALDTWNLDFVAYSVGPNPAGQTIGVTNLGGGTLAPRALANVPWLTVSADSSKLTVQARKVGLTPGLYNGTITVSADPARAQGSPQTVRVRLRVLAGPSPYPHLVHLPMVMR